MGALTTAPGQAPATTVFRGAFETHVTVRCDDAALARLDHWAAEAGMKITHIMLARGRTPSQPMLTSTAHGTFAELFGSARALTGVLEAAGFEPVRVKIEASPWAEGVPQDDTEAVRLGPGRYFEHHLKVVLDSDTDLAGLAALVTGHGAHLSWNARRAVGDGRCHERFITQRCHAAGLDSAGWQLDSLLCTVRMAGHHIVSVEREFVVYDSDITIDDGWIAEETTQ
ncbi:hypothetical protein C7C46_01610 [Streptomyces tateyamensis]|uniref:Ankyrin n=1 Tax=Streptomyces tateyamensis TaxID=565073 RepID=A0A2V4NQL3_9ACTN|nr:hypothetical protein [Streptomyces tateyamensis]PYC88075.1 hypothetical protein C7C46_01610 [Streptomyces tateyamensis]